MTIQQYDIPDDFLKQVKDALEHLYDFPYLQNHPLVTMAQSKAGSSESPAQHLRRELMDVIDTLSPGPDVPFRSPNARLYNVLHLRYVEGMTMQETANELGISLRQAYRDLRRGEESVAAILWSTHRQPSPPEEPKAMRLSSIQEEIARLESHPRPTDIHTLLQQAQKAVSSLARQHSLDFRLTTTSSPVVVATDPVIAHQVLVSILSQVVKQAQPGDIKLSLDADEKGSYLSLRYGPDPAAAAQAVVNPVVLQLTGRLGWQVEQADGPDSTRIVTIYMVRHGPTVLVVDDNEGLVELLGRYLTGHNCRVTAALSGQEGLKLAQELLPDAIVLDVMMPEMDGWEFLQRLRANAQTADIPVIICSVFNDPELAYSLGASANLAKPVKRQDILHALRRLKVV